ncbi:efflux RND transporter periplasmic adaptor subunit [Clostridium sp. D33t1_170424_F3]|uniref:efflux RND transporter periplasmic adaptor subunit n=1 Tax=Clostridium sp. D33t1_170424_F3 TaxID=2787099 RepID=UPI0018ABEC87|nr:efflux RND transporter periplasmic adaptor subunit [Clostridium sp. D33t1_170424_F3]
MKKKVLIVVGILAAVAVGVMFLRPQNTGSMAMPVELSPLQKTTLRSTVSTSGNVESTDAVNVYSNLTYPIKNIMVEVGDRVNAGDVLCLLDSDDLQQNIKQKQLSLASAKATSEQQIKSSQKKYNDEMNNVEEGLNTQLNTAQQTVNDAKLSVDNAQKDLDNAKANLDADLNAEQISAQSTFERAETELGRAEQALKDRRNELGSYYDSLKKDYDKALKAYEKAVRNKSDDEEELKADLLEAKEALAEAESEADSLYMKGTPSLSITQLRQNVTDAQQAYDTAKKNLDAVQKSVNTQLETFETNLSKAKDTYNNALKAQKAAQAAVTQGLEDSLQAVESSKLTADDRAAREELKSMQSKLENCTVTAPVSGTITAVYATEGASPSGVMFVIENTDALQLDVKIKEYDVNMIQPNMPAIIKADATGDGEFEGYLEKVAPTAVKTPLGDSGKSDAANTKDVEFDATVIVSSKDTGLRIGMTARADIVTEQKDGVFAVPYDALAMAADGSTVVYTVKTQEDGTSVAEAIPVTQGLETDYEVEISGEGLTEGMLLIADGKQVQPGMAVSVMPDAAAMGQTPAGVQGAAVNE